MAKVTSDITVYAGATMSNARINESRHMTILMGGSASGTTITSGGSVYVEPLGTLHDTTIQFGGMLFLDYTQERTDAEMEIFGLETSAGTGAIINGFTLLSSAFIGSGFNLSKVAVSSGAGIDGSGAVLNANLSVTSAVVESDGKLILVGGGLQEASIGSGGVLSAAAGTAKSTVILGGGQLILSGSAAHLDNTLVSSGGIVTVTNTNLTDTTIMAGATINGFYIRGNNSYSEGISISSAAVSAGKSATLYAGQVGSGILIAEGGKLYVSEGGHIIKASIASTGQLYILSGGTATFEFNPWQGTFVSSNGAVIDIEERDANIYYGGSASGVISSGDILENLNIISGNSAIVYGKGQLISAAVQRNGFLTVSSAGEASAAAVGQGGAMQVLFGGTAENTTVAASGKLELLGGTAESTTIARSGSMSIANEGTAINTTVSGILSIAQGAYAVDTTIGLNGHVTVAGEGKLKDTVMTGGIMEIGSGATHTGLLTLSENAKVNVAAGGCIEFDLEGRDPSESFIINDLSKLTGAPSYTVNISDSQLSGTYKLAREAQATQGMIFTVEGVSVAVGGSGKDDTFTYLLDLIGGDLTLTIQGPADCVKLSYIDVNNVISSGATMSGLSLTAGYLMTVDKGGLVTGNRLFNTGAIVVNSGGLAVDTQVGTGGQLHVFSGGNVKNTVLNQGGYLGIGGGASANNTVIGTSGTLTVWSGGEVVSNRVGPYGTLTLSAGAKADSTTINAAGGFHIFSGAEASNTIVNQSGFIGIGYGGKAVTTTIDYAGVMTVWGGGYVENNTVNTYAALILSSGANATSNRINALGGLHVYAGAVANSTTVMQNGFFGVGDGAKVYNTTIGSAGAMTIWGGGYAENNIVGVTGALLLSSGAKAVNTTVERNGGLHIYAGATASTVMIKSGASLGAGSGGVLNTVTVAKGASLTFYDGATLQGHNTLAGEIIVNGSLDAFGSDIVFDLTGADPYSNVMIENIDNIQGANYSLSVDSTMSTGRYYLAGSAENFCSSVSITGSEQYLTVGMSEIIIGTYAFTMGLDSSNNLYLDVAETPYLKLEDETDEILREKAFAGDLTAFADQGSAVSVCTGNVQTDAGIAWQDTAPLADLCASDALYKEALEEKNAVLAIA